MLKRAMLKKNGSRVKQVLTQIRRFSASERAGLIEELRRIPDMRREIFEYGDVSSEDWDKLYRWVKREIRANRVTKYTSAAEAKRHHDKLLSK